MGKRRVGTHGEVTLVFRGKWEDALKFEHFLREHALIDWDISTGETLFISVSAFPTPRQVQTDTYDLSGPVNYPRFFPYEDQSEQAPSEGEKAKEQGVMLDPIFQAHRAYGRAVAENHLRDEQVDPLSAAIAAYLRAVAEQLPLQSESEPSERDGADQR